MFDTLSIVRWVLLVVVFIVATGLVALVIGFMASLIANRFPKMKADMQDEGCSCTFGLIALASLAVAGLMTARTANWLFREEQRLATAYAPMLQRIEPLYRRMAFVPGDLREGTLKSPLSHQHEGTPLRDVRGIVVLDASPQGTLSVDSGAMAEVDERCRAAPEGMPRYVIATLENSVIIGHRVGAGAGPVYRYWTDVYLLDLAENDVLHARTPTQDPEDEVRSFLERAKGEGGCR